MWERTLAWLSANRRTLIAVLVALVGSGSLTIAVVDQGGAPVVSKTITLGGPQRATVTLDRAGQQALRQAEATDAGDHAGLRTEAPAGVPEAQLDEARAQQERLAASDQLPLVAPLAAPRQRGCITRQVANFSTRGGVRPRLFVLHYTVSRNAPGWGDVNGIVAFFNSASSQASSNYVIDNEGHCALIVQEASKAWTQATFNALSISAEVINTGAEPTYAGTAGLRQLAIVVSDAAARWDIPLQRGAVSGCTVTRPGIVDHNQLGACGGGHNDITPYSVEQVIAAARSARAGVSSPLTKVELRMVARVCALTRAATPARGRTVSFSVQRQLREARSDMRAHMNRVRSIARATPHGWDRRHRGVRYQVLARALRGTSCAR